MFEEKREYLKDYAKVSGEKLMQLYSAAINNDSVEDLQKRGIIKEDVEVEAYKSLLAEMEELRKDPKFEGVTFHVPSE